MLYLIRCFFALTRGLRGKCPCPICLVPKGSLSDLSVKYPERDEQRAQELVEKIEGKGVKDLKMRILGLRAVEVRASIY